MLLVRGRSAIIAALGRPLRGPGIAIGNFDGVHRGHQALIATARHLVGAAGGDVVALTFDPHPARVLAPKLAPPLIVSLARRAELLGEAGADVVVAEPFTREVAAVEAEAFAQDVLARDLGAAHVVVGYDFSFGRGRRGDTAMLEQLGARLGFAVSVVRRVSIHGLTCSSTKVREFVLEGRVEGAEVLLGRPFEVTGEIVRGAGRGRGLGFATANIKPEAELVPKPGIYAGRAMLLPAAEAGAPPPPGEPVRPVSAFAAAVSVGTNPTFGAGAALTVECHRLGWDGSDLYGRRLRLQFLLRLRDERRFSSVDELVAQIRADVDQTQQVVAEADAR
jgi:riboflavin kinase / FMN adenylyltransferase